MEMLSKSGIGSSSRLSGASTSSLSAICSTRSETAPGAPTCRAAALSGFGAAARFAAAAGLGAAAGFGFVCAADFAVVPA